MLLKIPDTPIAAAIETPLQRRALAGARAGLDFLVRHQVTDLATADHGRFPFVFDYGDGRVVSLTTNWITGVLVEAMICGYGVFADDRYLHAATRAVSYLKSLQSFTPGNPRMYGAFHEETPQTTWMHPRDGLTAGWALLTYGLYTGDDDALRRTRAFGEWFVNHAMKDGYPYWTAQFGDKPWDPDWFGSFHSGAALYLHKLARHTGDGRYQEAARSILAHYNQHHLDAEGRVTVIRDRRTLESLDGRGDRAWTNVGWEEMHVYNDDFGALANVAMYRAEGDDTYRDAAERFLGRMVRIQRSDGGFGPAGYAIPSAGGSVLIEMLAAEACGLDVAPRRSIERAVHYVLGLQQPEGSPGAGAFAGFSDQYRLDGRTANARAGGYAILALLRFGGATDGCYFVED